MRTLIVHAQRVPLRLGAGKVRRCRQCGADVPRTTRRCPTCGQPLSLGRRDDRR